MATAARPRSGLENRANQSTEGTNASNVDVVFIPGLASNGKYGSWSYNYTEKLGYRAAGGWSDASISKFAPGSRAVWFNYKKKDTSGVDPLLPDGSVVSMIEKHAKEFLRYLAKTREIHNGIDLAKRPLIMIAHSYGGLVLKKALILASSQSGIRESILGRTSSIIFLGTPHRGAEIGKMVANIIKQAFPETRLTIGDESSELVKIMEAFCGILGPIKIATFYENKETKLKSGDKQVVSWYHNPKLGAQIVPPTATIIGIKDEFPTGIACQHHLLTSPNDMGDIRFFHFWRRLIEFTKTAGQPSDRRGPQPTPPPLLQWCLPSPARRFFGRQKELSAIKDILLQNGEPVLGNPLTIYGLRGIGKSELVLQYIKSIELQSIYSATLWVQCSDRNMIFDSLRLIYNELSFRCPRMEHELRILENPSGEVTRRTLKAVIHGITKRLAALSPRPWLVVLDDIQFQLEGIEKLAAPNGQMIITTTEPKGSSSNLFEIRGVGDAAALLIITQSRRYRETMDRYSASMLIDDIQTINRKLGGNPFALNMLGAATHSTGLSEGRNNIPRPPNGSRTIGFQKDDFLAYANGPEHEEAEHILSVVNLAFGIMELKSRASITGLKILGHFNPIGITSTVLSDMILGGHGGWMYICDSGDQDEQQLDAEVRSFSEYNGNVWDILRFFGILNSSVNTETNQSRLLPHPIIRTWIQRHMSAAQVVKCVLFLGKSLSHFRILLHSWPMSWPELFNGEMASQLRCCFRHMEQLGFLNPGPENPFVKHQDSVLVPEGLAAGFKLFGDFQRCLKLSKLELDLWNDNSTLRGSSSLFELIRKISKGYWESRNPEKGLEMVQQAIDIDRGDVNPRLRDFQKKEVLYQKEQMQYQLAKLNGELDEDVECISDSEYELLDDEVVDILDLVSGKHEAGKLVEIISHSLNCDPADYDPDVLFQLLRFDIDLDTEEAVSLEAELIIKAFKSFIKNNADLGWCDHRRNTILHIAVKGNHSLIVELLLKYSFRFDINATDFTGMTPLAFAVTMGSRKSTELLIQAGAELDFRPWSTSPPLLFRALSTDIELEFLRYLLESGLRDNINEPHLNYGTILHHAAFTRSASVVALLLEYGADANAVDYMRLTPLALAVMLGYADGVLELLLARTDTNIHDYRGRHPSQLQCRGDTVAQIRHSHPPRFIRTSPVRLSRESRKAEVLVYYWLRSQSYRPRGYFLEVPSQMYHILMHAEFKDFAVLVRGHEKSLSVDRNGGIRSDRCYGCEKEVAFNASAFVCNNCCPTLFCADCRDRDNNPPTPTRGRDNCDPRFDVKLTEADCRPIINSKGFQFRRIAVNSIFAGTTETFKALHPDKHALWNSVESGQIGPVRDYFEGLPLSKRDMLGIDANDFTGYTILHYVAEEEKDGIFIYLASQGMALDASDIAGWSVAHSAATAARTTILKYMAAQGANLNVQDVYGRTPLHVAVLEGNLETVKLLLELGADQSIVDEDCRRPYDIESITPEMRRILLESEHTTRRPEASVLKGDPTSESRRVIRARKLDRSTLLNSNPLAYGKYLNLALSGPSGQRSGNSRP
ncbi:hypothetical protein TWF102_003707 [Orbilia oligospora]|uniref:Orc1-like AAA ATPase domain-containing protein n=1 Tax=Orbilia oligospora TaxID=2813651 RepID=A0A7C8NRV3_ORBOL|nr:hypothetical protein TWF102_003707 [Orbilia oligospora]KAF3105215.1 hypothetical protein TWF103_006676 [Orbilia oligospora]